MKEGIGMKKAIDQQMLTQMVKVKCGTCGHMFDSDPHDWVWDGDAMGLQVPYPPECPECGNNATCPMLTEVEREALCKTLGISRGDLVVF